MNAKRRLFIVPLIVLALVLVAAAASSAHATLSPKEELGKLIFFDRNLSSPPGQACAACHAPAVGFTGPDSKINKAGAVYEGAVKGRFGNRKPPASAYADGPVLYYDEVEGVWVGGTFLDGRATGWTLGDPLAEQAQGPFLNPLEQNMPSAAAVCAAVAASSYANRIPAVWGASFDCSTPDGVSVAYEQIARSIAAYERSAESQPFTSKYDYYLQGKVKLTGLERRGLELFEGKGQCSLCHLSQPGPNGEPPLFTDFTYDNLGVPRNPANPFYRMTDFNPDGANWVDLGLGGFLQSIGADNWQAEMGKFKVPTLRNVDLRPNNKVVKAYGHNGYFKSLEDIVRFYNTRDVNHWPPPEMAENVNTTELGNLRLKPGEEKAIVAFLKTLSDGYRPPGHRGHEADVVEEVDEPYLDYYFLPLVGD